MFLPRSVHRLGRDGWHSRDYRWNGNWRDWFDQQPNGKPDAESVLQRLLGMWERMP
jgi:hypothetical protein